MTLKETGSDVSCRVPTRAVDVELSIVCGRTEAATLYLSALSQTHSGPETMSETLNRVRAFLPARSRETDQTFLVRRSALRSVSIPLDSSEELLSSATSGCVDLVRLELDSGETLEGTLATVLPSDEARLSDYFNDTDSQFIAVAVAEGVTYVNRDYISIVWL